MELTGQALVTLSVVDMFSLCQYPADPSMSKVNLLNKVLIVSPCRNRGSISYS